MIFSNSTTIPQDTLQSAPYGMKNTITEGAFNVLPVVVADQSYGKDHNTLDANIAIRNLNQSNPVTKVSAVYSVLTTDTVILADASGGAFAINLLSAVGLDGRYFTFKKTDGVANNVTLTPTGGQTIDGAGTLVLTVAAPTATLVSD